MAVYATAAQWFERHDVRHIGQLINDDNIEINRLDLLNDSTVATLLQDASGEMDAALLTAQRYLDTDLSGLTGNALNHRVRICCDIAMSLACDRRTGHDPEVAQRHRERAEAHLEKLRTGVNIFDLTAQQEASNPTVDGPTSVDYQRQNLLVDRAHRYFSNRKQRLPTDRG